jgi:hypothetical protein
VREGGKQRHSTHTFFCANILMRERMTSIPRSSEAFSSSTAAPA